MSPNLSIYAKRRRNKRSNPIIEKIKKIIPTPSNEVEDLWTRTYGWDNWRDRLKKILKWLLFLLLALLLFWLLYYLFNKLFGENGKFEDIKENIIEKIDEQIAEKEYRWIIDEEQKDQLSWSKNVRITPITSWYYELVTTNEDDLIWAIIVSDYPIPEPKYWTSCSDSDKYWNFSSANWLDYNGFIYEYLNSKKTEDIVVAILDSWIDESNEKITSHLYNNELESNNALDDDNNWYIDDVNWVNIEAGNGNLNDDIGHGTHIAWIILQTFPKAKLLPIKVNWNNKEYYNNLSVLKWFKYAIDNWADIINMSFWSKSMSIVEEELIKEAVNKWIIVIAAAWNDGQNAKLYYPANYSWTISVSSFWLNWKSIFSNYWADLEMPWECIYSYRTKKTYEFMDWTSMAAPHLVWVLWWYLSLWNTLTWEDNIISKINNSSTLNWNVAVLKMPKLLWIENENNRFYEYLYDVNEILNSINNKLVELNENITPFSIKSTLSFIEKNKWKLATSADKIEKLYNELWISEWFWVTIKNDLNDYINFLSNSLDANSVQLTVSDKYLMNSLWVETCFTKEWNEGCSYEDRLNWCDDTSYYWHLCWSFSKIINKWVLLPSSWNSSYYTMKDYQTEMNFPIYQWEGKYIKSNKKLWNVTLKWLPMKLKWEATANVYFTIDKYWYLSVSAVDASNSNNKISTKVIAKTEEKLSETEELLKIKNNLQRALEESKNMINEIKKFNENFDPDNYIN